MLTVCRVYVRWVYIGKAHIFIYRIYHFTMFDRYFVTATHYIWPKMLYKSMEKNWIWEIKEGKTFFQWINSHLRRKNLCLHHLKLYVFFFVLSHEQDSHSGSMLLSNLFTAEKSSIHQTKTNIKHDTSSTGIWIYTCGRRQLEWKNGITTTVVRVAEQRKKQQTNSHVHGELNEVRGKGGGCRWA